MFLNLGTIYISISICENSLSCLLMYTFLYACFISIKSLKIPSFRLYYKIMTSIS